MSDALATITMALVDHENGMPPTELLRAALHGWAFMVANPTQVRILLDAVRRESKRGPHLVAFFGCLYYAAMRPSEAVALRVSICDLPPSEWGRPDLSGSEPSAGREWTDTRTLREARELKHRGKADTRSVPVPPELVRILSEHIATFGLAEAAGCFAVRRVVCCRRLPTELSGVRLANPPDSRAVRLAVGTSAVRLRHAGISLWLNAGVAATEVARRAGHSVAALLQVYANCIDREGWIYNEPIERALRPVGEQAEGFNRDRLAGASGEPNENCGRIVGRCEQDCH
jgi:integrase